MVESMKSNKLLVGIKSIRDKFDLTEDLFYMFMKLGLPVRKINGRWFGHEDNIDTFLKKVTVGPPIGQPGIDAED
jgi:hypothetical protein